MTLVELQAQRAELVEAMGDPVRRHQFEEQLTEMFGVDDLKKRLAWLDGEIAKVQAANAGAQGSRYAVAEFDDV